MVLRATVVFGHPASPVGQPRGWWRCGRDAAAAILGAAAFVLALGTAEAPGQPALPAGPSITVCVDPDWPPYEIINRKGLHEGIAADLLTLAADRAALRLELVPTKDWEASLAASRRGDCEILSFLNQTPKREEWLIFTEPLFVDPNVIITHEGHPFVADLGAEFNKIIVLPAGTSIEERVRRDFPALHVVITESEAEAFAMVSSRKADLTIRSLTVAVYTIKKEGWFNLKVSGQIPGYENKLRVGVRKEKPDLRAALDRGIAAVSPQERARIANEHVAINVQTAIDYDMIRNVVLGFSVILLSNLAWAMKLRKANMKLRHLAQTDQLTGLHNRTALDETLASEVERSSRAGRDFAIILIDVDHFKQINDEFGHPAGDRALVALAAILKAGIRAEDTAGRWGGEEFLILCPATDAALALDTAERICAAVREHGFDTGRRHTVSAGVAALRASDGRDGLLQRVDAALYQAKHEGRDRACLAN